MPEFHSARNETKEKQLAAAEALLNDAGVAVELEDLRRGHYRLKRDGAKDLELRTADYPASVIETTNWRRAGEEHYAGFWAGTPVRMASSS